MENRWLFGFFFFFLHEAVICQFPKHGSKSTSDHVDPGHRPDLWDSWYWVTEREKKRNNQLFLFYSNCIFKNLLDFPPHLTHSCRMSSLAAMCGKSICYLIKSRLKTFLFRKNLSRLFNFIFVFLDAISH